MIIDYLRKVNKSQILFWKLVNQYDCLISTVTLFELYSGAKSEEHKKDIKIVLSFLNVIYFDSEQAKLSSGIFQVLKQHNRLIEFRDIFIASYAISEEVSLATLNTKHFTRINNLSLYRDA